jgi:hypothetical protein
MNPATDYKPVVVALRGAIDRGAAVAWDEHEFQALEAVALLCEREPLVQELLDAARAYADAMGAAICPGPLEQRLRNAIDQVAPPCA